MTGLHDKMIEILIPYLDEYEHHSRRSTVKRAFEAIGNNDKTIWLGAYLEMPVSMNSALMDKDLGSDSITSISISGINLYEPVYIAVPESRWGRILISKIDEILKDDQNLISIADEYEVYLESSAGPGYREIYRTYYRDNFGIKML